MFCNTILFILLIHILGVHLGMGIYLGMSVFEQKVLTCCTWVYVRAWAITGEYHKRMYELHSMSISGFIIGENWLISTGYDINGCKTTECFYGDQL